MLFFKYDVIIIRCYLYSLHYYIYPNLISELHVLVSPRADRTKTGYILGNPQNRIDFPVTERGLQPASHSLLSVLLHAALLLGACENSNVSVLLLLFLERLCMSIDVDKLNYNSDIQDEHSYKCN